MAPNTACAQLRREFRYPISEHQRYLAKGIAISG
jgi:hypothetical protein